MTFGLGLRRGIATGVICLDVVAVRGRMGVAWQPVIATSTKLMAIAQNAQRRN